ncbi:unnamed protein product [Calypogeia fissa]
MGRLSAPTLRFLHQEHMKETPEVGEPQHAQPSKTMVEGGEIWRTPETTVESLVNNCLVETYKGAAQMLKKRRTVAPDPEESHFRNVLALLRAKLDQNQLEIQLWNQFALKQYEEITGLRQKVEELWGELQRLENLKCLQTDKWRKEAKTLALELKVQNEGMDALRSNYGAQIVRWRNDAMTLAKQVKVKDWEIEALRKNAESDKLQIVEAHKLEFDVVISKAKQVEGLFKIALGNYRTSLSRAESMKSQSETQMMKWVESVRLEGCEQNQALDGLMDPQSHSSREDFVEFMGQYHDTVFRRREFLEAVEQCHNAVFKTARSGEDG